jgi:hypothetical protein
VLYLKQIHDDEVPLVTIFSVQGSAQFIAVRFPKTSNEP